MSKRLYIRYGDLELCADLEVDEFTWTETATGISVTGKVKPARAASPGGGLLDIITAASRRQTDTKRAELAAVDAEEAS